MGVKKISELAADAALDGTEIIPVVGGGATARTTVQDIVDLAQSGTTDADYLITRGYLRMLDERGVDYGPEIHMTGFNGGWVQGIDVANTPKSRDFVDAAVLNTYKFDDAATTSGSPTLTSAAGGGFVSSLVGKTISGAGIPNGTTVIAVGSATSLTMSANATATAANVQVTITRTGVTDVGYWKHRGALPATYGVGVTPPDGSARLQVGAGHADELGLGGIKILMAAGFSGKAFKVTDSADVDRLWIDSSGSFVGANGTYGCSVAIKGDATNQRPVVMAKNDGSAAYGFGYSGNDLSFQYFSGGVEAWRADTAGTLRIMQKLLLSGGGGGGFGGGGLNCIAIENTNIVPTTNPAGGGVMYAEAGAGKWRGSSGTVTTFGTADPHCPDCGRDFALEWESDQYGYLALCMWCVTEGMTKGVIGRVAAA